jgi:hypothetical protein
MGITLTPDLRWQLPCAEILPIQLDSNLLARSITKPDGITILVDFSDKQGFTDRIFYHVLDA